MADERKEESPAAQLGRLGGLARVPKGLAKMTKKKRAEIARKGVEARRRKASEAKKKSGGKT